MQRLLILKGSKDKMENKEMELTCPKCEYCWISRAKLYYVTCPNCQRKFPKPMDEEAK